MKIPPFRNFIVPILFLISFSIISFNFYVAETLKYEAGGDAGDFLNLGVGLSEFHKYGNVTATEGFPDVFKNYKKEFTFSHYSTWRPPVWPFLISIIFFFCGYNLTYILVLKFLLHLFGVYLFYKTLQIMRMQSFIILLGTFLYSVSPAWQLYTRTFLSEPITLFFITLWLYLIIGYIKKKFPIWPQAITAGIIVLCHPYYLFLPFSTWLALLLYREIKWKPLIFSSIICAALVSVWVIRNTITLDTPHLVLTTSSGAVMAKGWNKNVPEEHSNTQGDLADEGLVLRDFKYDRTVSLGEVEKMKLYQKASFHFIKENPNLILPILTTKLKSAFNPFPETSKPGILEFGRTIFHLLSLLSMLYLLIFSSNKLIRAFVLGLLFSTIAITIITYSGFRFRMPQVVLELLFIIYATGSILKRMTYTLDKQV